MSLADTLAAYRAGYIRIATFLTMELDAGDVRLCTGERNLTLASEVYLGDGTLHDIEYSASRLNELAGGFEVTLSGAMGASGVTNGLTDAAGLNLRGIPLQGRLATASVALISATDVASSVILSAVGTIDTLARTISGTETTLTLRIEKVGLLGRQTKPRRYSLNAHQALNPDSTLMRQWPLPALVWGGGA